MQLAGADLAAAEEYFQLIQARATEGIVTDFEAARRKALLSDLRGRLPALNFQESQSINQLSLLMGEHPGALQVELQSPAQPSAAHPLPRIALTGNFGFESIDASNLTAWSSRTWEVGPSLEIPVFDMGRRRGVVTLRKLQQQEAAVAYQRTVLTAWHEIDTALSSYSAERQRNDRLLQRESESLDAYQLAQVCYENGLTTELDALDAERTLISAQRDHADSQSQLPLRLLAIYKARGGGASGVEMAFSPPPWKFPR